MAEDALRAEGVTPDEARALAARTMGQTLAAREAAHDVWIAPWIGSLWRDARYAVRSLRRSPGFALTALATLTLGIGVNATLFTFANALLMQPWPAPEPDRLVLAYHRQPERLVGVSGAELAMLREQAQTVDIAGTRQIDGTLSTRSGSRSVQGRLVSGNYFDVVGLPMTVGRALRPDDDRPGAMPVIVIGYDLWTAFFSGDPLVIGRALTFRDVAFTVVGVAGAGMRESPLAGLPQVWLPLASMPTLFPGESFAQEFLSSPAHCCVDLVGRLRPDAGRAQAEAELSSLDRHFRAGKRSDAGEPSDLGMQLTGTETMYEPEAARMVSVFALLSAAAMLVLVLTCANVGNLQLARAAARRREITIRLALGATRHRVVGLLLAEGFVLAGLATILCVAASSLVARMIMARVSASVARMLDFSIDGRGVLFAVGLTVVVCLVTSLAPALRGSRQLVAGRGADPSTIRLRSTFLAAQVAICVVLLTAAMLLGRGLARAASQDVGFTLETLMALRIDRRVERPDDDRAFMTAVMAALDGRRATAAAVLPLGNASFHTGARRPGDPEDVEQQVRFHPVSPGYFDVLGIPLVAGRTFDGAASDEVVVNETLARLLWPDGDAVGQSLAGACCVTPRRVVGIAADARISGLGDVGPMFFQPTETVPYLLFNKGDLAPDELTAVIARVDPGATTSVHALGDNVGSSLASATMGARLAAGVGMLALVIAAVGIGGVFSFAVTERTREVGIRLALGATRRRVQAMLLRRSGQPVAIGLAIGLALAIVVGQALRSFLFGLRSSDPVSFAGVIVLVLSTALFATVVPMRRALRIDPATTLRDE